MTLDGSVYTLLRGTYIVPVVKLISLFSKSCLYFFEKGILLFLADEILSNFNMPTHYGYNFLRRSVQPFALLFALGAFS